MMLQANAASTSSWTRVYYVRLWAILAPCIRWWLVKHCTNLDGDLLLHANQITSFQLLAVGPSGCYSETFTKVGTEAFNTNILAIARSYTGMRILCQWIEPMGSMDFVHKQPYLAQANKEWVSVPYSQTVPHSQTPLAYSTFGGDYGKILRSVHPHWDASSRHPQPLDLIDRPDREHSNPIVRLATRESDLAEIYHGSR